MRVMALTDAATPWHSFWIRFGQYASNLGPAVTISTDPTGIAALQRNDALVLYRYNLSWGDLSPTLASARERGVRLLADLDDFLWQAPGWPPERLRPFTAALRLCHTLTCSTPTLMEVLQVMFHDAEVVLVRNGTPRPRQQPAASRDGVVRLCWTGAPWTRPQDLALLQPLAQWSCRHHAAIRWLHIGHSPGRLSLAEALGINADQVECLPLMPHTTYLEAISGDIGLAPLATGAFNSFKSELKLLEYSGLGMAWVASAAAPYQHLCEHWAWAGRLCSTPHEWIAHVEALLDQQVRQQEGDALKSLAHSLQSHDHTLRRWRQVLGLEQL